MPIYEYACSSCGKTIEVIQKFSDKPLKKHVGCGGALTKLISQSGFQFKGTGWYVTDYARKSQPKESEGSKEAKTDSKDSKDSGGSGESKGNSKSDNKKDSSPAKESSKGDSPKPAAKESKASKGGKAD